MTYQPIARPNTQPSRWITGPDLLTHLQYRAFIQQRNQARWRGETWHLSLEQYQHIWQGRWDQRGRTQTQLMMTRRDAAEPWQVDNCEIITRQAHGQRQAERRMAGIRSRARSRELEEIAAAAFASLSAVPVTKRGCAGLREPKHPHDDATTTDNQYSSSSNYSSQNTGEHNG